MTDSIDARKLADELAGLGDELQTGSVPDYVVRGAVAQLVLNNLPAIVTALREAGEMREALTSIHAALDDYIGRKQSVDVDIALAFERARAALGGDQ